jgi:calmodulin
VEIGELATILRASNRLPTESELIEIKANLSNGSESKNSSFSFADLVTILAKLPIVDSLTLRAALLDAFRVFDQTGSGEIGAQELRHIMTSLGEKLSEEEANEMVKLADPTNTGTIKYETFVDKLVAS